MAREFRLPDIGEGLTEAEIVRWLIPVGGEVAVDQPVVEVETDKAVVEIPSPFGGVVLQHGGAEGEVIEVGSILLVVGDADEVASSRPESPAPEPQDRPTATPPSPEPAAVPAADESTAESMFRSEAPEAPEIDASDLGEDGFPVGGVASPPIVGTLDEEAEDLTATPATPMAPSVSRVKALPLVRKLARDNGVDIESVTGSGPDGRVTREDVMRVASLRGPTEDDEPVVADDAGDRSDVGAESSSEGVGEARRMSRLRRTIAANMSRSWAEIPHVTTFDDVDATRLLEVREALSHRHQIKMPIEALVIKAVVPALEAFPEFNATLDGDELTLHENYDVGIAVDTPDGLLVARIEAADRRSVLELAEEVTRLGSGARDRRLSPDEVKGQTFTVSNIGAVGGGHGTPIVPYGTTAILSVGRAREKVIVSDGDVVIAPVMPLSLSYDHRVVDGAQGRRFMSVVMENLEEPALFLAG